VSQHIGVGPINDLRLRISVATLTRVIFPHPEDGTPMLALEHKATMISDGGKSKATVKVQPFGGAIRILDTDRLITQVGEFNFDSKRSCAKNDFRIYVQPSAWNAVRDFCLRQLSQEAGSALESVPSRELHEEFEDTLEIQLIPEQYSLIFVRTIVENEPLPTANVHAAGIPTVRIYRIDEAHIDDPALCQLMIANSQAHPRQLLEKLALEDAQQGGRGRANAIFVAPLAKIRDAFLALPPEQRGTPLPFDGTLLEGNVAAVLDGVSVPKYRVAE
jgi:hypothetical protein